MTVAIHRNTSVRPLRILPLGDSITQGGVVGRPEYTYRLPLQRLLSEHGIAFEFIGSLTGGLHEEATWPEPFDPHHEGRYGWKTAAVRDELPIWGLAWSHLPDVAIVHLGSNDQDEDPRLGIVEPLSDIVAYLREMNPRIVVLLGHLHYNEGKPAEEIRPAVAALAHSLNSKESPVVAVDTFDGWVANPEDPDTDTFDWAHPNEKGQAKLARKFFDAMLPLIGREVGQLLTGSMRRIPEPAVVRG